MLYEDWCHQERGCLWATANPKNVREFVKHLKRENQ
jgi:hypothetical protein